MGLDVNLKLQPRNTWKKFSEIAFSASYHALRGLLGLVAALLLFANNLGDFLIKYRQSIFLTILYNFIILKIRIKLYYFNNSNIRKVI